ncbi:MAG TPA: twin-arginine translocase TatA/TatE family subunit [Acidobacteriaceae bacterium]|jgi:sec-independent protein translocase protein TatB|nr:twin-arginine translocase TatA/TatE family subunit [Acidobacteriaceae bacterium]
MPSFPDSIFLFVLALLLFGPKRLPVLARELGKWVGEFRRASNEFKMQMEDELRLSEQAERNKQIAAMEAAAPVAPAIPAEDGVKVSETGAADVEAAEGSVAAQVSEAGPGAPGVEVGDTGVGTEYEVVDGVKTPLPIAVSGELKIMPPKTGLPVAASGGPRSSALKGLLDAIPAAETLPVEAGSALVETQVRESGPGAPGFEVDETAHNGASATETTVHGD